MPDYTPTAQDIERLRTSVETLRQEIAAARTEPVTSMRSPQLDTFWAAAQQVADDNNMCGVFDRIARDMGGRSREDDYLVEVEATVTIRAWVRMTGRNPEDARDRIEEDMGADDLSEAIREVADSAAFQVTEHRTTGDVREDT